MKNFIDLYKTLNPKQKQAVDEINGPIMVIAGPGTGKTHVLTMRIANILKKTDTNPNNILALTFTDNAANNMKIRLANLIGKDAYKIKCTTFHGFCNDIIQNYPEKFQTNKQLKQLLDIEKHQIVEKILDEHDFQYIKRFHTPYIYKSDIISSISNLKREGISPKDFSKLIKIEKEKILSQIKINPKTNKPIGKHQSLLDNLHKNEELQIVYEKYQLYLNENGLYDYEDMILKVETQLRKDEELLADLQEQYLYILVDEFQDTNGAQFKLLTHLTNFDDLPNIFVVGDDDQSIYRFQGANLENMLDFLQNFPKTKIINLDITYRLPANVIKASRSLISNNKTSIQNYRKNFHKTLKTINNYKTFTHFYNLKTEEEETIFISNKIIDLINRQNIDPRQIAVLYRNNNDADDIIKFLELNKIPTNISYDFAIFDDKYIKQFLELLSTILFDEEKEYDTLFHVLNHEYLNINRLELFKFAKQAQIDHKGLWQQALDLLESEDFQKNFPSLFQFFTEFLEYKHKLLIMHPVEFFEYLLNQSGLLNFLLHNKRTKSISAFRDLFVFLKTKSLNDNNYSIRQFLEDINKITEEKINLTFSYNVKKEGVNFMTVHKAKGLEFDYVFIIKLRDKKWGNRIPRDKIKLPATIFDKVNINEIDKNEEERRVLFVAMTRTKKELYLSSSEQKIEEGKITHFTPSQFINEIDEELLKRSEPEILTKDHDNYNAMSLSILNEDKLNLTKEEKAWLYSLIKNFRLNVTALNNFLEDPYYFLLHNLIRIPSIKNSYLVIGTIIHSILEQFGKDKMQGKLKDIEYYTNLADVFVKKEFLTDKKREKTAIEAKQIIKPFLEKEFQSTSKILKVEYKFPYTIFLDDIPLSGKIDRIDQLDNKETSIIPFAKIIDFKTGNPKTRNQILGQTKNSDEKLLRQLQFYKLLCNLHTSFPYKITEYSLRFVQTNKNGKFVEHTFDDNEINTEPLIETIKDVMKKIRNLKFDLQA